MALGIVRLCQHGRERAAIGSADGTGESGGTRYVDTVMEVLKASRAVPVSDAELQRLRELPLEAVWGALQNKKHIRSFEGNFRLTVASPKIVGRAVTMRYLPVRPD